MAQLLEPYPEFCGGASASQEPVGFSNYNSLQATYTHRVTQGLIFMASYTYSKFLADAGGPEEWASHQQRRRYGFAIHYDLAAEKSASDSTDVPQSLVLNYMVYELPRLGEVRKSVARHEQVRRCRCWWMASIRNYSRPGRIPAIDRQCQCQLRESLGRQSTRERRAGVEFQERHMPQWPSGGEQDLLVPIRCLLRKRTHTHSAMPPVTSPICGLLDTSTRIWESKNGSTSQRNSACSFTSLAFQMFNAFNHTNFDSPDINLGDSTMGQIGGSQGARQVQLALKITR